MRGRSGCAARASRSPERARPAPEALARISHSRVALQSASAGFEAGSVVSLFAQSELPARTVPRLSNERTAHGVILNRPIRIASWPHWYEPNLYLPLLYQALAPYGIEHMRDVPLEPKALSAHSIDVLHLHWPYPIWRDSGRRAPRNLITIGRFWRFLSRVKHRGVRVIWTVHNARSHDGHDFIDHLGHRLLYHKADLCVFHSQSAQREAAALYGNRSGATLIMAHGSYEGALPTAATRAQTLGSLAIPQGKRVLLCFGQIRRYKGFDLAVKALDYLPADEYHLIIAGRLMQSRTELLGADDKAFGNLTLIGEDLDDQRLADLLGAADVVLLPYRAITASGALLHALTVGKGVVASDLPYFREILSANPEAGVLVAPENPDALASGIREFFTMDLTRRGRSARTIATGHTWDTVVPPLANWIRQETARSARA
jgi:beta-1,4-mannosyltransferase